MTFLCSDQNKKRKKKEWKFLCKSWWKICAHCDPINLVGFIDDIYNRIEECYEILKYMEAQPSEKVSTNLFLPTFASRVQWWWIVCFLLCVFVLLFFISFDCFSLNEIVFDVRSMVCNHSSMWGSNFISFSFY